MHRSLAINNRNPIDLFALISFFFWQFLQRNTRTHSHIPMQIWLIDWLGEEKEIREDLFRWFSGIRSSIDISIDEDRRKEYELPPIDSLWVFFWVDLSRFLIVIQFCFVLLLFFSMLANLFSDLIDFWSSWRPAAVALDLVLNFFSSCSLTRDWSFVFVGLFVSLPRNYCCYCSFLTIGWSALKRLQNYKAKLRL